MIQRYVAKISGPLLDRIDIHIEVPAVQYKELRGGAAAEGSAQIRARVMAARERQRQRFKKHNEKIYANAQMTTRQIRAYCELGPDAERLLERAMQQQGLTARAHDRILKVARTIADLEGAEPSPSLTWPKPSNTERLIAATGPEVPASRARRYQKIAPTYFLPGKYGSYLECERFLNSWAVFHRCPAPGFR